VRESPQSQAEKKGRKGVGTAVLQQQAGGSPRTQVLSSVQAGEVLPQRQVPESVCAELHPSRGPR